MLRLQRAELRDSWTAWLGVSLAFIVINASLTITMITYWTGHVAIRDGRLEYLQSAYYTITQMLVGLCILFVAIPVIHSATGLVVESRRGSLARLALAGATPGQVSATITVQLAVVSLACGLIGAVIGVLSIDGWFAFTTYGNRDETMFEVVDPVVEAGPILATCLACMLVAVVAGARQARAASLIPPVEALRLAQAAPRKVRLGAGGWVKLILLGLLIAASFVSVPIQLEHRYKETISNLMILGFLQIFFWSALLAVVAPVLVRPVTRWWTRLIPSMSPAWQLARSTVSARADRLYKSVVPVMFTFAIGVGSMVLGDSGIGAMVAYLGDATIKVPTWDSHLYLFGLPLLIAFMSGVGVLIMMSKQRDAELALVAIVGATPAQRVAVPAFEALIITTTGLLLSLIAVMPSLIFQAYSLRAAELGWSLVLSWPLILGVFAGGFLLTLLSTVLPTLPALRKSEPRVIARLVAE
ncbi:FtsX-like permease family protein [Tessaracoccus caeni]|uniref:FtsX-like permease family protein n=1 Tax=Tessaracoccus caeni TaxID=3031239 RepID=UPI0023DBE4F1|nr:FtsX-like permease family protein [Tessaracoccus caeni]MDF1487175.1 hypothetical protein [Tessaracoccus caeni]